ncbi:MAG TPA: serine/threonine-protein kinase, partial [Trebonia sp.]|nr:serine/threonine-protein kinase [Trebonia sp.]
MPALESLPGKIGPYRILEKVGEGGMGVVYLARDAERRQVALKVLGPAVIGDPSARKRLSREVETMRRVHSPFVAEILDADVDGASPYVVTQYVQGQTLEDAVKKDGPLRGLALQRFAHGLASALAAIHAAGVVHRDLKPGNVMLAADGEPVVIDFGIANMTDGTRVTQTGIVMGTPGYLAPEVIEGEPSSPASDVHSWGATVAFAATGRHPFGTGTFQTIFFRVLNGQAELSGVPETVLPLLAASLTRNPRNRPSAGWLAAQCAALGRVGAQSINDDRTAASRTMVDRTAVDRTALGQTALDQTALDRTAVDRMAAAGGTLLGPPGGFAGAGAVHPDPYAPAAAAASLSDLLPPVDYARPANGARPPAGPWPDDGWADRFRADRARAYADQAQVPRPGGMAAGDRGQAARREARPVAGQGLVSLAIGVAAVAVAIALPVAGTLLALAAITLLRAVGLAEEGLASRRSAYGARASDALVVIVTAPWKVVRAVLTTAALAPLTLMVAALAAGASVIIGHTTSLPDAGSWAAGAAVAWSAVGPGSRAPRAEIRRITMGVARGPGTMA